MDRWLTIEESPIDIVRADGSVTLLGLIEHATEPHFFDQPPSDVVARSASWSGQVHDPIPDELERLASSPALQLAVDSRLDRIEHVDIQVLSGPVTDVAYKVAFTDSVVRVAGLQPQVVLPGDPAAKRAVRRPLRRRQLLLGIASALVFLLGIVIFGSYSDRHQYGGVCGCSCSDL